MVLLEHACGGHCSTFPFISRFSSLHLHFFSALPSHFLSSFCSVTLSLLTLSLFLSHTNVLSHRCLSLLSLTLSVSPSHPFSSSCSTISLLVDTHFLSFIPSFFYILHAHFCCLSATFCSGFLIDTEASTLPSHSHEIMLVTMHKWLDLLPFAPFCHSLHLHIAAGYN